VKLLLVIISNHDADLVIKNLIDEEYRVTRIATTGGFMRRGNTTLMIGTEEALIDRAIELIGDSCAEPDQPGHRRATVFVLDVDEFTQV
jgi:uncharacterized protein YaaQ